MTHFTDQDIGDLAEDVLDTIDGMRRALRTKLPGDIGASIERERRLRALAVRILETLGRLKPAARPASKQLLIVDDAEATPGNLPD